jgi:polysaccharide biosynthesis protein PslH
MKILQLCKKFPYPPKDGESIAVTSLSKSLNELGCDVTLLAMNTVRHFFNTSTLPRHFNHYSDIHTVEVDNRIKPWDAFMNLFSPDSYHISRFVSTQFRDRLISLLKQGNFDLVQLETLYLAPYIPYIRQYSDAVIAMRAHNVEHEIWQRITDNTPFYPKRWYLDHLTRKLKSYEIEQLNNYDILVAITQRDLHTFRELGYRNAAVVTPIGIEAARYKPDFGSFHRDLSVAFIGSLDWMPNQEGLTWFLEKVWCHAVREFPDLKLHIAGRNTPAWMRHMSLKNVVVHGEVPDAPDFINQHSIMVVPLLSGSGMRAKILEGMALGKVVLSTKLGLEGIHARHKSEVIVADHPEQFIQGIKYCYRKKGKLEQFGRRAQEFVARNYHSREIARNLLKTYSGLTVEAL